MVFLFVILFFFFFNDTATTEIYTLSLHDALPILRCSTRCCCAASCKPCVQARSEEHTSELQSHVNLVCRLLLEKKKTHPLLTKSLNETQHTEAEHAHRQAV